MEHGGTCLLLALFGEYACLHRSALFSTIWRLWRWSTYGTPNMGWVDYTWWRYAAHSDSNCFTLSSTKLTMEHTPCVVDLRFEIGSFSCSLKFSRQQSTIVVPQWRVRWIQWAHFFKAMHSTMFCGNRVMTSTNQSPWGPWGPWIDVISIFRPQMAICHMMIPHLEPQLIFPSETKSHDPHPAVYLPQHNNVYQL